MTLKAEGITVRAGKATLLDGVSLALESGEVVAIVGPNGAGKTTLIRSLAGDIRPTEGRVTLSDRALDRWAGNELAVRRAVMAADGNVAFGYTAREVALMGRMPSNGGEATADDEALVDGLLEAVDCAGLAGRTFNTLSTGERQRVQLARAIAQVVVDHGPTDASDDAADDRFLLLDEPTSSLDPAHQHSAMGLIRRQARDRTGVLAVLHDLNLAAAYADRIVVMADAGVAAVGSPDEVLDAGLLQSVFHVPMLVLPHPELAHPVVIAHPAQDP